jgi:hypothetical protein
MDYVRLAYALLNSGESRHAVVAFLRAEYGLALDEAREAVTVAAAFPTDAKRSARRRRARDDDRFRRADRGLSDEFASPSRTTPS